MKVKKLIVSSLIICGLTLSASFANDVQNIEQSAVNNQINKELFYNFSYQELVELSKTKDPKGILREKLDYILYNPIVDNSISSGENIQLQKDPEIGEFIRFASWNIERGINIDAIKMIFTDSDKLFSTIESKNKPEVIKLLKEEAEILKNANILILNEVDVGMPRTQYRNVVEEMAQALKMNYAYGVEFLEVDPAHLGLEDYKWSEERFLFPDKEKIQIDKAKYRGLHGTAILSKYPLKNCRIVRLPQVYDWFDGETKRISELEIVKRHAAEKIFREEMIREIRQGSRMALLADIEVPGLDEPITIVALHLENRSVPKGRRKQMVALLKSIDEIKNPVVMAGDLNTTTWDGTPTSITREIKKKLKDPEFIAKTTLSVIFPPVGMVNSASFATNFVRKHSDPTVKNIPIIAPNKERALFEKIKDTEFKDDYRFDFRGVRCKSTNSKVGMLANSNERRLRGFVPTFIFERPLHFGKYKLDWFFVKAYLKNPKDKKGPYKLAPHYGRTLFDLNYSFESPLADHVPITIDLPINEPSEFIDCEEDEQEDQDDLLEDLLEDNIY
ncbi:MAG: hypothetical protein ACD_20C00176G0002 [uncultured bacterium]|nr:MAG: hypothetical protein ACD_20C00176G0002 [uncultured bacterium]HBH17426.1 hypothetical protein [Cyanobacteria bacterium UBA9579]